MADTTFERTYYPGTFVARLVNTTIGIIEFALFLRVVLELLGANPASGFVAQIYSITSSMIGPFAGAFPALSLGGASMIDVVAIVAMIAYAIVGWLVMQLLLLMFA